MKAKTVGLVALAAVVAAVIAIMLIGHGDEQVSGVALADTAISDTTALDGILSSKGAKLAGFGGTLYATAVVEFGKYARTDAAPIPQGKGLYACVLFVASPQGTEYKAVWSIDGEKVKEESKTISSPAKREAVSYLLDGSLVRKGSCTLEIQLAGKRIYSQQFIVG
jgi:hypothetical protein